MGSKVASADDGLQAAVKAALAAFVECRRRIEAEMVFSPNESKDDIKTADLKYVLGPWYQAELQLKLAVIDPAERVGLLEATGSLYREYLSDCERKELISCAADLAAATRDPATQLDPGATRNEKIERYKRAKQQVRPCLGGGVCGGSSLCAAGCEL